MSTPETTAELLQAYTEANGLHWKAHHRMHSAKAMLDLTIKDQTAALKVAVRKIVRGTGWYAETVKYWLSIGHGTKPVTMSIHGHIVIQRYQGGCRTETTYHFNPAAESAVLAEIRQIARPNAQAQTRRENT